MILFKSATPTLTVSVMRPRNEEKRARKQAIKEERKVRVTPSLAVSSCDCCCCPVFVGEESREEGDQASLQERGTQVRENFSWSTTNCSCCLITISLRAFQIPSPIFLLFLCESFLCMNFHKFNHNIVIRFQNSSPTPFSVPSNACLGCEDGRMLHRRDRTFMLTSSCCEGSRVSPQLPSTLCILSHD